MFKNSFYKSRMKKVSLPLLLTFLASTSYSMEREETEGQKVERITREIDGIDQQIHRDLERFQLLPIDEIVVVLGNSGNGKSTLMNFLVGHPLCSIVGRFYSKVDLLTPPRLNADGSPILEDERGRPIFPIGRGQGASETAAPRFWYDQHNRRVYYDCPGFNDTRVPENDIRNAYAIDKLFKTFGEKIKVLWAVAEDNLKGNAQNFQNDVKTIAAFFQNDIARFGNSCCVALTRQDRATIAAVRDTFGDYAGNAGLNLSAEARTLLQSLSTLPTVRVAFIPEARAPGNFLDLNTQEGQKTLHDILDSLRGTPILGGDPRAIDSRPAVSDTAKDFAQALANGLNSRIGEYISTTVVPAIYGYCDQRVQHYNQTDTYIGNYFNQLRAYLDFNHPPTLPAFEGNLQNVLQTCGVPNLYDEIRRHIEYITFLRQINANVDYRCADWISSFRDPHSRNLAQGIADGLNMNTRHHISGIVAPAIYNYCDGRIQNNNGTVASLRNHFTQLAGHLVFNHPPTLPQFEQRLQNVLPTCGVPDTYVRIANNASYINFLQGINPNITYDLPNWIMPLSPVRDDITSLGEIVSINNSHEIRGFLVGTSDLPDNLTQDVKLYGLNTIIVDSDIVRHGTYVNPGVSVSLMAPHLQVIGQRTIDVSGAHNGTPGDNGVPGAPGVANGTDGKPGKAGGNGGNVFYRIHTCTNAPNLTINTSGGNGSNGGDGGAGADGLNGPNGLLAPSRVERNVSFYRWGHEINPDVAQRWRDFNNIPGFMDWLEGASTVQPFPINDLNAILDQNLLGLGVELVKDYNRKVRQRDIWHHQLTLRGNKEYYGNQGTDATPPTNGGKAGAKGRGGRYGQIHGDGVGINFTFIQQNGNDGNNGSRGTGGNGNVSHGQHCTGIRYTDVYASHGNHALGSWEFPGEKVRHTGPRGGYLNPGITPDALDTNTDGEEIPSLKTPAPIKRNRIIRAYNDDYDAQLNLPLRNHFLRDFPNRK
jgi:hypothetical protein